MYTTRYPGPDHRLFLAVMEKIKTGIAQGHLAPNGRLPNEAELCGLFMVSRVTVRRAIAELEEQGIVVRRQGSGTFVREPCHKQSLNAPYQLVRDLPGAVAVHKALSMRSLFSSERALFQSPRATREAHLTMVTRLVLLAEKPIAIQQFFLPHFLFSATKRNLFVQESLPTPDLLLSTPTQSNETIRADMLHRTEAAMLETPYPSCGLVIERIAMVEHRAVYQTKTIAHPQRYQLEMTLR